MIQPFLLGLLPLNYILKLLINYRYKMIKNRLLVDINLLIPR